MGTNTSLSLVTTSLDLHKPTHLTSQAQLLLIACKKDQLLYDLVSRRKSFMIKDESRRIYFSRDYINLVLDLPVFVILIPYHPQGEKKWKDSIGFCCPCTGLSERTRKKDGKTSSTKLCVLTIVRKKM